MTTTYLQDSANAVLHQIKERLATAGVNVEVAKKREIKPLYGALFFRYEVERNGLVLNWQIDRQNSMCYMVSLHLDTMWLYSERSGWEAMNAQAEAGAPGVSISLVCSLVAGQPNQWGRMETVSEPEHADLEDVNPKLREFVFQQGWADEEGLNEAEWHECVDSMAKFFLGN